MSLTRSLSAALIVLVLSAGSAAAQVVVSSKIDTEGGVLGHIILAVLNGAGIATTDRTQLGGTPVMRKAIIAGEVDIYPEYTGNAAFFFNKAEDAVWKDAEAGYQLARQLDLEANRIVWLAPAPANNTWGIALRRTVAQANNLRTLTEFGQWVKRGGQVVLAASAEFVSSPAALPTFQTTYGFILRPAQLITLSGGDTAATIAAAANQISGANAAMVYGTDGGITPSGLMVLEDDKNVQPVYRPAPIVREAVLKQHPRIESLLQPAFERLTLMVLQDLNARVQLGGEPAKAVARDFLKQNRLTQ